MKKITLCIMLIFAILIFPVAIFAAEGDVAKIGDVGYATLADAVKAVPTDKTEATTIELLKSVENGPGIVTEKGQNLIIDFNGYSYDASEPTVGSNGTKTLGAQLNKGSKVVLKDGTFTTVKGKRVIQNYADLTLNNMVIDGTKGEIVGYVASFNNGKVEITGNTSIISKEGDCAFDVCWWPKGYSNGTQVVINTTGKIDGNIEIGDLYEVTDAQKADIKSTLEIKDVKLDGKIIVAKDYFLKKLGVNYKVLGGTYSDLGSVVNLIPKDTDTTIELLRDVENGSGIVTVAGQKVTIDFNGYSYDASEPTVGSDGTKTLACQLNKGSTVTFKNGTFTTLKGKRLIQNYANLTLDNMVIDGTKGPIVGYVASFNNGKVEVKGNTSILAKEGDCAFDVCWWPQGYPNGTQVEINTTGKIDGNIEIGDYLTVTDAQKADIKATLEIKDANFDGEIKVAKEYLAAGIGENFKVTGGTYTTDVKDYVAEGLVCKKIADIYRVGKEYTITVKDVEGGKVTVNPTKAILGEKVTITVTPNEGYELISLEQFVNDEAKADLASNDSFTMLFDEDVELRPLFVKLTTEAAVPNEVANEKEVKEMLLETLKELAKDPEVAAKLEGKNIEVEVKVNTVDNTITDSEKEDIEKEAAKKDEDLKLVSYLDITIVVKDAKTDEELTTMPEVEETITFTVAVPEGLPKVAEGFTRIFYIVRNHNGAVDVLETKEVDGKLIFESDKFSTYAIAYKDVENSEEGGSEVEPEAKPEVVPPTEGEKGEAEIEQETQPEEKPEAKPETKPSTPDVPKTGDNVVIFAVIAVVAMMGIAVAIKMRRK